MLIKKSILMVDFNMTTSNPNLGQFLDIFTLSPLTTDRTYFKNSKNLICVDILLTNSNLVSWKHVFLKLVSSTITTIMKVHFTCESPKIKYIQNYSKFSIVYFSSELYRKLDSIFSKIEKNEGVKNYIIIIKDTIKAYFCLRHTLF